MASTDSSFDTLRVGILFLPPVQLLDVSPVDLFYMLSREYLELCGLPAPLARLGITVMFSHISPDGPGSDIPCTANGLFKATAGLDDVAVQPGMLDVLVIPGPPPDAVPSEAAKAFIRGHAAHEKTDVMTICTGIFAAGHAGILDGKTVTAPRGLIPKCRKLFPAAEFHADRRWVRDSALWCSGMFSMTGTPNGGPVLMADAMVGGITNGQDMVAVYLKEHWPGPLSNVVCALADVGDRPPEYDTSAGTDVGWFVWQIVRSLFTKKRAK